MNLQRYAQHQVDNEHNFSFCSEEYSRFKFGDGQVARKYGTELAMGFIQNCLKNETEVPQLVIISSPYAFIPTATFVMKNHFVYCLNKWLAANQFPVVQETKIHRTITYKEDYGELDAAQRMALIGNDTFHIDAEFLKGKTLVFLDDIRITGSHEKMILKMATQYGIKNKAWLLYFAELTNARVHPRIENYLNHAFVQTLFDLTTIVNGVDFQINTRVTKFLLNADPAIFNLFIQDQSMAFVELLLDMAIGNQYHNIEAYKDNLNKLQEINTLSNSINHGN